jgi:retron-type reverse transcriptase
MADGVRQPVSEGTPQGSPLSPLLSNIMLDDFD